MYNRVCFYYKKTFTPLPLPSVLSQKACTQFQQGCTAARRTFLSPTPLFSNFLEILLLRCQSVDYFPPMLTPLHPPLQHRAATYQYGHHTSRRLAAVKAAGDTLCTPFFFMKGSEWAHSWCWQQEGGTAFPIATTARQGATRLSTKNCI